MSSSTFEVKEPEIENNKDLDFGLDTVEENGISLSAQSDSELPKDHTYTKEPDGGKSDEDDDAKDESLNNKVEDMEESVSLPIKSRPSRATKSLKAVKKPVPKSKSPVKKSASPIKKRGKKDNSPKEQPVEESLSNGGIEEKDSKATDITEEKSKPATKKGRKRKVEEKEVVIDQSIVDEVHNIAEESTESSAVVEESPKKRAKAPAKKETKDVKVKKPPPKKSILTSDGEIETKGLPKGWVKKSVVRKSGRTAGTIDIYIYSPEGIKFRSRPELASFFKRTKSSLKLDDFDFSKKAPEASASSVKKPAKKPAVQKPTPVKKKEKKAPAASPKKLLVKISTKKIKTKKDVKSSMKKEVKVGKGKGAKKNSKST